MSMCMINLNKVNNGESEKKVYYFKSYTSNANHGFNWEVAIRIGEVILPIHNNIILYYCILHEVGN